MLRLVEPNIFLGAVGQTGENIYTRAPCSMRPYLPTYVCKYVRTRSSTTGGGEILGKAVG